MQLKSSLVLKTEIQIHSWEAIKKDFMSGFGKIARIFWFVCRCSIRSTQPVRPGRDLTVDWSVPSSFPGDFLFSVANGGNDFPLNLIPALTQTTLMCLKVFVYGFSGTRDYELWLLMFVYSSFDC